MRIVTNRPHPADLDPLPDTIEFHRGLAGYRQTPLVDATASPSLSISITCG